MADDASRQRKSRNGIAALSQGTMMKKALMFTACLCSGAFLSPAAADFSALAGPSQTGEVLLGLIRKTESSNVTGDTVLSMGTASGYVQAVRDHNSYNRWNTVAVMKAQPIAAMDDGKGAISKLFFCEPPRMSNAQLLAITKKFLEQHPERWNEGAFNLVADAFKLAYPCKVEDLFH